MSTRRRCDVTLLEPALLYPWVASGLKLVVVFEMIGILAESNILPFFLTEYEDFILFR